MSVARIERDGDKVRYASVKWSPEDVLTLRKDWTEEQAEEWLHDNARFIEDAMCERGWEVIEQLLGDEDGDEDEAEDAS